MSDTNPSTSVLLIRTFCPLLLLLLIAINGVGLIGGWRIQADFDENRSLADFPQWDGSLPHYLRAFDSFVKDNFPFRKPLLLGFNSTLYYGFHSTTQSKVILGKDDWIFGTDYDSTDGKFEVRQLSPEYLQKLRVSLEERRDWLAEQGIGFYVIFYPTKTTVYGEKYLPDHLPFDFKTPSLNSQVQQFLGKALAENFVPIEQPLRAAAAKSDEYYYLTDTHATQEGAFLAIETMLTQMRENDSSLPIATYPEFEFKPDVLSPTAYGRVMGIPFKDYSRVRVPLGGFNTKPTDLPPDLKSHTTDYPHPFYYTNPLLKDTRLLMLGDSFTDRMIVYLGEFFAETITIGLNNSPLTPEGKFPTNLISAFKPDVVVVAYVESRLADSTNGLDANLVPLLNPPAVRQSRLRRIFTTSQESVRQMQIKESRPDNQFIALEILPDSSLPAEGNVLLEIEYRGEKTITFSRKELPGKFSAESRELTLSPESRSGFLFLPRDQSGALSILHTDQTELDLSQLSIKGKVLSPELL